VSLCFASLLQVSQAVCIVCTALINNPNRRNASMSSIDLNTNSATERVRLSETVYSQLLDDVLSGTITVGERLPSETQLAERFSVSRPVVREALQRLQSDGVVLSRQGSGSYVQRSPAHQVGELTRTFTLHEVLESFELRLAIESLSAGLAARNRSDAQLKAIEKAAKGLKAAFDQRQAAQEADYGFHRAIALASGNGLLLATLDQLADRHKSGMTVTLSLTRQASALRRSRVLDEHERIVNAIRVADPESASIAMRYHIDQARNRLLDRQLDR
jgi:GntR family transcriptional regulator, transcriptional repressor for pyruvate dehydrogenase complex